MSIRSVTDLAMKRDATPKGQIVPSDSPGRDQERVGDTVVSAIPTEVLVLYTTITGGALATIIQTAPRSYLPYRWAALAAAVLLTPTAVVVVYRRKYRLHRRVLEGQRRGAELRASARWPWPEMLSATLAAAAWFLALPGSPLLAVLGDDAAALTSASILVGAAALLWIGFGQPLQMGQADEPVGGPPAERQRETVAGHDPTTGSAPPPRTSPEAAPRTGRPSPPVPPPTR
ncbi:hypothetical protein ACI797_13570 [Geodermatophilus sp. SYSU D00691]